MSKPDDERCIALTNAGNRCSRIAKDGRFCFQHDASAETINNAAENTTFISAISDQISIRPERLSGLTRDVAENLEDIGSEIQNPSELLRSGDFTDAVSAYKQPVEETAGESAKMGLIGGVLGTPFGPIGFAAGGTAGLWYGVYRSVDDDRAVAARVVDSPPESAQVVDSTHSAIVDTQPIQLAIQSAIEKPQGKSEWLRNTVSRSRDMDAVSDALEQLPSSHTNNEVQVYYIHDADTEQVLEVTFGIPVEE